MSENHIIGFKSFKMGDVGATGGMGSTLTAAPLSTKGTFKMTTSEPTVQKYYQDGKPRPVEAVVTGNIDEMIEFTFYDLNPASVVDFLGGTATAAVPGTSGAKYEASSSLENIEQSFEWESNNGVKYQIVRGLISANLDCNLGEEGIWSVKVKITILEPTDGTSKAWNYVLPTPAA